jgi:hypothetical protein
VREVTLFEVEVLEALARNDPPLQQAPIRLDPSEHRRNLTVRGVPLGHLAGVRFRIGDVVLRGGPAELPLQVSGTASEAPGLPGALQPLGLELRDRGRRHHPGGAVIEPL